MLKTRRFGYDGKGQAMIRNGGDPALFNELGGQAQILEAFVPFEREISVVAARSASGQIESFDVIENEHRDHILKTSRVPADVTPAVAAEARRIAEKIAEAFDYVGVLAVEMFVVKDGAGHAVLVNEIAPRVHNSGHWTHRRRVGLAVRAAHPRGRRPAARQADPARAHRDDQPARRRREGPRTAGSQRPAPRCISTARPPCGRAAKWATSRRCSPIRA